MGCNEYVTTAGLARGRASDEHPPSGPPPHTFIRAPGLETSTHPGSNTTAATPIFGNRVDVRAKLAPRRILHPQSIGKALSRSRLLLVNRSERPKIG
jgi:hypothetical protein